jgi:desert hedgehog protein
LPPLAANIGDTIQFIWEGKFNVFIHPSGSCSKNGAILVGSANGVAYTFSAADGGKDIVFTSDVGNYCVKGLIMTVTVPAAPTLSPTPSPVVPTQATPAPTLASVVAAPITPAPTVETPAPVTSAPVTYAPVAPTAPTAQQEVLWEIPEQSQLAPREVTVGDSITFVWEGVSNVYMHPSGNCSKVGSILVGNESGTTYTFTKSEEMKRVTFASQIGFHCQKGQILNVQVSIEVVRDGIVFFVPCFSGDALVEVESRGSIAMSSLMIGDRVRVAGNKFEPVYSFGHYDSERSAEFLQIYSGGAPVPIEISRDHLILSDGEHWVPAGTLLAGDRLNDADGNRVSITKVQRVNRKGVYAPFTASGSVIVNNVVASNYVAFQGAEHIQVAGVSTPFSYQWVAHIFNSVHRVAYKMGLTGETYTDSGVSRWVSVPHQCGLWLLNQHPIVMLSILVPLIVVFTTISFIEQNSVLVFTLAAALICSSGFRLKKGKADKR